MIPLTPSDPGAEAGQRVLDALRTDERPKLLLWASDDPILPWSVGERFGEVLGVAPERVEGAGHFLQEDAGAEIGRRIAAWLGSEKNH
jgi:haloalkane dehalogenase